MTDRADELARMLASLILATEEGPDGIAISDLEETAYEARALLFNLGYDPRTGEQRSTEI